LGYKQSIALAALGASLLAGCGQQQAAPPVAPRQLPTVTVGELQKQLTKAPATFVLDVRTPQEYDGPLGHVEGARLMPVQEFSRRMAELADVKDRPIYVICRNGNRSATATRMLLEAGYQAANVAGGMRAWNALRGSH